jgi:hypothetical protein
MTRFSTVDAPTDVPGTFLAYENGTIEAGSGMWVAFGADTRWTNLLLTGNQDCNSSTFGGDPAPGTAKTCVIGPWNGA